MIIINPDRCNGCGACLEVCPNGAIYMVDSHATVDGTLCRDCQVCVTACPTEAIAVAQPVPQPAAMPIRVPVPRPEQEVLQAGIQPAPVSRRAKVLPVVSAALSWASREIMPRLADYVLDSLDRRTAEKRAESALRTTPDNGSLARATGRGRGGQRQRRRRRRGGME